MWQLWILMLVAYGVASWYSLVLSAAPVATCHEDFDQPCYRPLITPGQEVTMELWLLQEIENDGSIRMDWVSVPSCRFNVTLPEMGRLPTLITGNGTECSVPIPDRARQRSTIQSHVHPLRASFTVYAAGTKTAAVGAVLFEITRVIERRPRQFWTPGSKSQESSVGARNLLEHPPPHRTNETSSKTTEIKEPTWVPYLKYGRAPLRIRFVAEDRNYGRLERADGLRLQRWNETTYAPMIYVDDLSLQKSAQVELAPPEDGKPPIKLTIKLSSLSPVLDSLNRQTHTAFETIEQLLPGEELDEIRYFLQDERLYRFVLTQIISYLHLMFDYLAFRDEIRFYKGRKNLSGVSTSTAITRFFCSLIILLYLMDSGGTSWVVLFSMLSSVCVDGWKVWRLLRPEWKRTFPFVAIRQLQTSREQETADYDRIAFKNLAMVLYPLVIGCALFALRHYEYKSWYSWLISNLANAVYTFGFISLCPQLYVNYRLKSVAHLPWKVFMYKIFNTFVDDAFAWIIEMPWKHRIMTLRDDVIFLMFLVQVYQYRVDKSRTNEFGYSYDDSGEDKVDPGGMAVPNTEALNGPDPASRNGSTIEKEKQL
jgi:predicted permease